MVNDLDSGNKKNVNTDGQSSSNPSSKPDTTSDNLQLPLMEIREELDENDNIVSSKVSPYDPNHLADSLTTSSKSKTLNKEKSTTGTTSTKNSSNKATVTGLNSTDKKKADSKETKPSIESSKPIKPETPQQHQPSQLEKKVNASKSLNPPASKSQPKSKSKSKLKSNPTPSTTTPPTTVSTSHKPAQTLTPTPAKPVPKPKTTSDPLPARISKSPKSILKEPKIVELKDDDITTDSTSSKPISHAQLDSFSPVHIREDLDEDGNVIERTVQQNPDYYSDKKTSGKSNANRSKDDHDDDKEVDDDQLQELLEDMAIVPKTENQSDVKIEEFRC
ncbi:unnamed protein product [Ambrosiozyma monospora]|uniref:Unnamed protein product n=1 Tax=Ambrosiozyma monospora TaxID=43982 RepID=A0A9W6T2R9_AMBMO|nr:unnamed protein product [Ambrosiozyma monospora]